MKAPRLFACLLGLATSSVFAQKPLLNVFFDRFNGPYYEASFLKSEIQFVNYTLDATQADVLVQQTSELVGNGTRREMLYFFGNGRFAGRNDTTSFIVQPTDPQGLAREKMLRAFKQGLLVYLLQTEWAASIDYALADPPSNFDARDGWNLWTFNLSLDGTASSNGFSDNNGFYGKYGSRTADRSGAFEASVWRTGQRFRFDAGLRHSGEYRRTVLENYPFFAGATNVDTTLDEASNHSSLGIEAAYALGKRFSVGAWSNVSRNYTLRPPFKGLRHDLDVALGIEYSLVPYEDWFRRQFALGYYLSLDLNDVYLSDPAGPFALNAYLTYARIEKWGYIGGRISGSYQIGQESLWNTLGGRARVSGGINLRKGLFLTLSGDFRLSNFQEFSPANTFPVVYSINARYCDFSTSIGIAYYFGSGYQNIINPRLWAATR